MKQADRTILQKMVKYCDDTASIVQRFGNAEEKYKSDFVYQYAASMCILQIGELVSRLSDEAKQEAIHIPWRMIRSMRNVFAHDYEKADHSLAWQTITEDIPALRGQLLELLDHDKES